MWSAETMCITRAGFWSDEFSDQSNKRILLSILNYSAAIEERQWTRSSWNIQLFLSTRYRTLFFKIFTYFPYFFVFHNDNKAIRFFNRKTSPKHFFTGCFTDWIMCLGRETLSPLYFRTNCGRFPSHDTVDERKLQNTSGKMGEEVKKNAEMWRRDNNEEKLLILSSYHE